NEAKEQSNAVRKEFKARCDSKLLQEKITRASSTNSFNTVSTPVNSASASRTFSPVGPSSGLSFVSFGGSFPIYVANLPHDPIMPELEDTAKIRSTGIFGNAYDDHDLETLNTPYAGQSVGAEADFNNMEPSTIFSPIPTTSVHFTHLKAHIIGDPKSVNCLFAGFLSQHEPTKISQALDDESWVEAMQDELLQFKIQKVWTLVDLPSGKKALVQSGYLEFPEKVYKVRKALYGLHQAPRAWYETLSTYLLDNGFHRGQIDKTLFIKRLKGDILLVQVYADDIIFGSTKKSLCDEFEQIMHNSLRTASTPVNKALTKDEEGEDVDVHLYSDYAGASLDRKSTIGGCQFLSSRLISWQCKKQTVVANLTTEAEYIAASHCCGQVLWIQNQLLDYVYNFMQTKIHVNNESAICVIKNPVYHSKTKHIKIRHHFI
ncbi:putative ribonuclease H-like domain-containing protein, partial [Tanacetum coccineum]